VVIPRRKKSTSKNAPKESGKKAAKKTVKKSAKKGSKEIICTENEEGRESGETPSRTEICRKEKDR
jgi:hypothetical protein